MFQKLSLDARLRRCNEDGIWAESEARKTDTHRQDKGASAIQSNANHHGRNGRKAKLMKPRHRKHRRSRNAEYEMQRELAEQSAAMETLNIQLDILSQDGIERVVKRAFESIEKQVVSASGREKAK
jgi:hypothetical protein